MKFIKLLLVLFIIMALGSCEKENTIEEEVAIEKEMTIANKLPGTVLCVDSAGGTTYYLVDYGSGVYFLESSDGGSQQLDYDNAMNHLSFMGCN